MNPILSLVRRAESAEDRELSETNAKLAALEKEMEALKLAADAK